MNFDNLDKLFINKILNLAYLNRNSFFNKILFFDEFLSIYLNFMNNIVLTKINYNSFFIIL